MPDGRQLRPGYLGHGVGVFIVSACFPGLPLGFMIPRMLGDVERVQDVAWGTVLGWAVMVAAGMVALWWLAGGRARFVLLADPFQGTGDRVRLAGEFEWRDLLHAQWAHVRPRPLFAVLGLIILSASLAFSILSIRDQGPTWQGMAGLTFPVMLTGYFLAYVPVRVFRGFKRSPLLHGAWLLTFDRDGLEAEGPYGQSHLPWNVFSKWRDGNSVVLLYPRGSQPLLVPLRFASSDADRARVLGILRHRLGAAA